MIHEVQGDLLLSTAQAIAHSVAPADHFDQGLALALREQWPAMAKDFRHYCHESNPKPGELWAWMGADGRKIVNLMMQEPADGHHNHAHPGKAKSEHVHHALKALAKWAQDEKVKSLALPRLATGVGGLDWKDVGPMIHRDLGELKIPVYVYSEYRKGVKAKEA